MPGSVARNRKRICLLGAPLDTSYSSEFWRGAADAARDEKLDFIYAVGGLQVNYFDGFTPTCHPFELRSTLGYQLIDPSTVDGIVVWGAQWGHDADGETIKDLLSRFHPLPIVSVGMGFPGIHSVLVNNYLGMRELVSHLLEVHRCRAIAFLKSDTTVIQPEAEERFQAYRDALGAYGVAYDPRLVILGSDLYEDWRLSQDGGTYIVRWARMGLEILIERRGLLPGRDFQAIVARDDHAALTVMEALAERGYRVPRDVAVCGFDDVRDARCARSPLTTVHQSFYKQGAEAVRVLAKILRGQKVPEETILDTARLVIRRSCGCPNRFMRRAPPETPAGNGAAQRALRLAAAMESVPKESALGYVRKVWKAFEELRTSPSSVDDFMEAIERTSHEMHDEGYDIMEAAALLTQIKIESATLDGDGYGDSQRIVEEATVLLGDIAQRFQLKERLAVEYNQAKLDAISQSIIKSFDLDQALNTVERQLPELGIPGCSIAIYRDPEHPLEASSLCFSVSGGKRRPELFYPGIVFPSRELLPESYWPKGRQPFSLIVWPVFFTENRIGFLVFERGNPEGRPYFNVASHIGSVFQGALLVKALSEKKLELEKTYREILELSNRDTLTGLYNRRAFQRELLREKQRMDRYSDRSRSTYSLLFIDLDNFKYYNDSYGHVVGDAALKAFAEMLTSRIRSTDTVARFGGDEFVALLPETSLRGAEILAGRILDRIKECGHLTQRIEQLTKVRISVPEDRLLGCSIGIACYGYEPDGEAILKSADRALLKAKSEGKGRYWVTEDS
jgi:diguanylate cyclase (GGDEF)-like protein